ncbi:MULTISPECIES: STAS domain-containing protein [Halomonadaceae]|uniref:STAS domain-containing protein n=1 Tax=Halomonas TaxID=2745 RepID=UPI0018A70711|nr:STAS domain-containing protein [Halomonas sp. 328]MBF8223046.1 STAS domain-containing protein [Halomonas sp. 328]
MTLLLEAQGVRLSAEENRLRVAGDVDFEVAASLAAAGSDWLAGLAPGTRVVIDLSGVDRVSSAALSMLLQWLRDSRGAGAKVIGVELSAPLARLTRLADLDALLPGQGAAAS